MKNKVIAKSQKKGAAKPKIRKKAAKTSASTDTKALLLAERIYAELPPLSEVARRAFRGRTSDAACDALGTQTRSELVLGDGLRWIQLMAPVVESAPRGLAYSPSRLAWFIERVVTLHHAREKMLSDADKTHMARSNAALAEARAVAARSDLLAALTRLAGDVASDVHALAAARGSAADDDALKLSLGALADLADAWLGRAAKDPEVKILVDDAGLTRALVTEACDASVGLTSSGVDAAATGRLASRDTPSVNRAEGWVLHEMKIAHDAFEAANEKDATIEKLVPGTGTRRMVTGRSNGAPVAPAPATNGAPQAASTVTTQVRSAKKAKKSKRPKR